MSIENITLPHLTNKIVTHAKKTRLCSMAVALEGWRRGLTLTWYTADSEHFENMVIFGVNPPGRLFSLSSEERTHYFFRTRGDKVSNEAVEIGSEKDLTKKYLAKEGVPVPEGLGFYEEDTDETILQKAEEIGYPLVLKPTDGSLGNGVVTNITSKEKMEKAIQYVRHKLEYNDLVLERYMRGKEYRFYVVEDQVVAVYNRIPANITGDGEHTVEELIELKNIERKKNARLHSCLIEVDDEIMDFLADAEYGFQDVPPKGEKIYLREKTNVSSGGDPIDVTDDMDSYYKDIAIRALKAVPGLPHGGVDMIIDDSLPKEKSAAIIELNPTAQIGGPLFPLKGMSRDIPKAIIDYYFPETVNRRTENEMMYFDLPTIFEPLENRSALEVEVASVPMKKLRVKKLTITGKVARRGFMNDISRYAIKHGLHGELNQNYNDELEIIVGAPGKDEMEAFKEYIRSSSRAKVKKVKEDSWKEPITVGFELVETFNVKRRGSVNQMLKKIRRDHNKLKKDTYKLEKDNLRIKTSTSLKLGSRLIK